MRASSPAAESEATTGTHGVAGEEVDRRVCMHACILGVSGGRGRSGEPVLLMLQPTKQLTGA